MNSSSEPTLPSDIEVNESFTRFIFSRRHFAPEKGRVKPQAIQPRFNAHRARWETSTHRIDGLTAAEIWKLGYANVEDARTDQRIKARGTGSFALVTTQELALDVNGPPFPRHVDIIGWSTTDKDLRLMQATEIANKMQLEVDPRAPGRTR